MAILGKRIDELTLLPTVYIEGTDILHLLESLSGGGYDNKRVNIDSLTSYIGETIATDLSGISAVVDQNSGDIIVLSAAIDVNITNINILSAKFGLADVNTQTVSTYVLKTDDLGKTIDMIYPTSNVVVIPSEAFQLGTEIAIAQIGTGVTSISADPDVYLNGVLSGTAIVQREFGITAIRNISADYWVIFGATSGVV